MAIVGIDALLIRRPTGSAAAQGDTRKCGIPHQTIMIAASHSHSAGPTGMILPDEFDHDSDLVKSLAYNKSSMAKANISGVSSKPSSTLWLTPTKTRSRPAAAPAQASKRRWRSIAAFAWLAA